MITVKLDDLLWTHRKKAKDVAKATGLSPNTISMLRNNKNKNFNENTLNQLCKYFNCKIEDLLEYVPD